MVEQNSFRVLL